MLRIEVAGRFDNGRLLENTGVVPDQSVHESRSPIKDSVGFVIFALLDIQEANRFQTLRHRPRIAAFLSGVRSEIRELGCFGKVTPVSIDVRCQGLGVRQITNESPGSR